ncbi:DUF1178 family protein [Acidisphaera sp. S103]|uniref:DUF1178 family protein n=1 Tax=Acidisphaera sp. S103 TaxID=1747223 RepID=UPI00131D880D|nr:DUF1178 family protein [Acidisphaera sp. S103]
MIHYQLRCGQAHGFDGWFKDSASFEKQAKRGLIECPECGGTDIERALMAPALGRREAVPAVVEAPPPAPSAAPPENVPAVRLPARMVAALQRMRAEVEKHCDYVGPDFADQARAMHRGEAEPKAIYGETSDEQAESLAEEGISVSRIPWVPRADG